MMTRNFDSSTLLEAASAAAGQAYAPYSNFQVGAAVLTASGSLFSGCNVENASYGLTLCAERVAMLKAVSEGERDFVALAVVSTGAVPPCGACRQVLHEFAPTLEIILADDLGKLRKTCSLKDLLPDAFGSSALPASDPEIKKT